MFWWGHFFSLTLQLSGRYKQQFEKRIADSVEVMNKEGYYICTGDDPWEHHFENSNYSPLADCNSRLLQEQLGKPFIKLAIKIPVQEWELAGIFLTGRFQEISKLLGG